jgi:HIV-1 Vpr-binding protein
LSEIVEYETIEYLKMDPDPFDERHPSKTHPDCALGHTLKVLFKKESFMNKLALEYMKETWGEELDLQVNTAACRLFVNILPGVENSLVYQVPELEGTVFEELRYLMRW